MPDKSGMRTMYDGGMFVYVANSGSMDIWVHQLDLETGDLTEVQQIPVSDKILPATVSLPLAISPDRRFLYAALRSEPYTVTSFAIDPLSGRLRHLASAPLADSMAYISTDRTGRFLLGSSTLGAPSGKNGAKHTGASGDIISINAIGPHGFVQPPHQIVRIGPKMHAILPDPSNRFVFATSCDGGFIVGHVFSASAGMLSPNPLPPVRVQPNSGPRHFAFHPNNRFLYLLNETSASIYTFGYDASTGALNELQVSSALAPDFKSEKEHSNAHAADLHLSPDGSLLYASVRISHTLAGFKVDPVCGMLTYAGSFSTEREPRAFNIDPSGRHLLAVGGHSHSMTSYAISRDTGNLTKLKQYAMGKGPNWVEIVRLP